MNTAQPCPGEVADASADDLSNLEVEVLQDSLRQGLIGEFYKYTH